MARSIYIRRKLRIAKEEQEKIEKSEKEKRDAEWASRLAKLEQEEREVLELQSAPFRTYLMDNIMPTLTAGLIELCKVKPTDPIDYLVRMRIRVSIRMSRSRSKARIGGRDEKTFLSLL